MAKVLNIKYDNEVYTLEYTRRSVETMEQTGFIAAELKDKPGTMIPMLIAGAFMAHHKGLKRKKIDEIYDHIPNRGDFIAKLAEMYNEPILALIDDPEENEGNASWTASW